ncbi:MAG: MFS transporter [Candidatus Methanodesulfokora sp.]|jgi:DHA1 family multidrug resistance protein-like MFS transporter
MPSVKFSNIILLYTVVLLIAISVRSVSPFISIYLKDIGYSPTLIGAIMSVLGIGGLLARLIGGYITDEIGIRSGVLVGIFLSIAGIASFLLPSLAWMGAFLLGFGIGASTPPLSVAVGKVTGKLRGTAYGILSSIRESPGVFAPILGAFVVSWGYNFLFMTSALVLLLSALLMLSIGELWARERGRIGLSGLPLNRTVLLCLFSSFIGGISIGFSVSIWPVFIVERFGSLTGMALTFSIYSATAIVTSPLMGLLSDRLKDRRGTAGIGCLLFSLSYYLFTISPSIYVIFLLEILSALAASLVVPSIYVMIFEESGEDKGKFMGFFGAVEVFGRAVGPAMGGILYSLNANFPWIFLALLELILAPFFLRLPQHSK